MNSSSTKTNSTKWWNSDGSQEQVKEDSSVKLNITNIDGGTQSLDTSDNLLGTLETYSKVVSANNDFVNTFKQTLLRQTELLRSIISLIGKQ